jgi:hypothetical protein
LKGMLKFLRFWLRKLLVNKKYTNVCLVDAILVKNKNMDSDEILELVKDGTIEPDQIEDFENLDEPLQELVADGDLDISDL